MRAKELTTSVSGQRARRNLRFFPHLTDAKIEGEYTMPEQSLYERLGGVNAIAMVVDRFSDQIVANPKLNVNPNLKEWHAKERLEGLKFMRTLWICQTAGGPFQ
jgi:hemoglobin